MAESNVLYDTLESTTNQIKEANYNDTVSPEEQTRLNTEVDLINNLVKEGRKQTEVCQASHDALIADIKNGTLDDIDAHMSIINNFSKLNDHIVHIESKVPTLVEACTAKSIDSTTLTTLTGE